MSPKTPVAKIKALLSKDLREKKHAEFVKLMTELKVSIVGNEDGKPAPEVVNQVVLDIIESNLIVDFVEKLPTLPFEAKKLAVLLVNKSVQREINDVQPGVAYMLKHFDLISTMCNGYEGGEDALNYGQMIRVCVQQQPIAKILLAQHSELVYLFFDFVNKNQFDIASDAFSTLKTMLTAHKVPCADFLEANYDEVFSRYEKLLESDNYVTRRQSLKLLGEMLLDRANFTVMTKYIADVENLKRMMKLLKDQSRNIQFEAFHVFKVFVANPNKADDIKKMLQRNKDKLVKYLTDFHKDKSEEEQFEDEKKYLIKQIKELN